jgi:hypothetical protein
LASIRAHPPNPRHPRCPEAFVATWRGNTSTERQVCQQHFLDLCALVGHHRLSS